MIDGYNILRNTVHYGGHFVVPLIISGVFYKEKWFKVTLILVATMLVDLDHLVATPIFDPERCSVGFHILHSYFAIAIYGILFFLQKTRLVALGLLLHMFFDFQDCFW